MRGVPSIHRFCCKASVLSRLSCALPTAVANVGLGLSLFGSEFSRFSNLTLLWVYVGYIIFTVILNLLMYVVCKCCCRRKDEPKDGFAVKMDKTDDVIITESVGNNQEEEEENVEKRKEPSHDSRFRWLGLVVFVTVTVLVVIALLVLVALPLA